MREAPTQKLAELIRLHGRDALNDRQLCALWLSRLGPDHKRDVHVLLEAIDENVPGDLAAAHDDGAVGDDLRETLTRRLCTERALNENASRWAVGSWASAIAQATPSNVEPGPAAVAVRRAEASPDSESDQAHREKIISKLNELLTANAQLKKADEDDPFVGMVIFGAVVGGIVGFLVGASYTQGLGILAGLISGGLVVYWQHCKKERVLCPRRQLVAAKIGAIRVTVPGLVEAWGGEQSLNRAETVQEMVKDLREGGAINAAFHSPRTGPTIASTRLPAAAATLQPHRGGLILALGILGVFFPLLSIFAWSMGHSDLGAINSGRMDRAGFSLTSTGRTLGMFASLGYLTLIGLGVLSALLKQ
jgi:hypothetical protein